jgi:hypothetical protein
MGGMFGLITRGTSPEEIESAAGTGGERTRVPGDGCHGSFLRASNRMTPSLTPNSEGR